LYRGTLPDSSERCFFRGAIANAISATVCFDDSLAPHLDISYDAFRPFISTFYFLFYNTGQPSLRCTGLFNTLNQFYFHLPFADWFVPLSSGSFQLLLCIQSFNPTNTMAGLGIPEKLELIKENLIEVLDFKIVENVLAEGRNPKIYWGTCFHHFALTLGRL
jgi:hypothetical protein